MLGWISIHRKIFDNPVMTKPNYLSVWVYLLLRANYKEKKIIWNNEKVTIERGQFIGSIKQIADFYKLSKSTVAHILDYLERDLMIVKKSNKRFTLFEIMNYDKYQNVGRVVERLGSSEPLDNKGLDRGQKKSLDGSLFSSCVQIETNNNDNNENNKRDVENEFEQVPIFSINEIPTKEQLIENEFNKFWNYYDKKVKRIKCLAKWLRLSAADQILIREHLPKYIKSTPDKKFRKDPSTYLNNESWNDEIISSQKSEDNLNSKPSLVNKIGVQ
jgi:hypothetical protein